MRINVVKMNAREERRERVTSSRKLLTQETSLETFAEYLDRFTECHLLR